jgi:hypothetical protein
VIHLFAKKTEKSQGRQEFKFSDNENNPELEKKRHFLLQAKNK